MAFSTIGAIIGGNKQAKAQKRAGAALSGAADYGIGLQEGARDYTMGAFQPLADLFPSALSGYVGDVQSGAYDPRNFAFEADPGYQFRLDEGQKALDRSAAARGGLLSGAQMKAGQRYAQDFASNEYDRAYGRNANALATVANMNAGLVDLGLGGVGAQVGAQQDFARNAANLKLGGAGAQANALVGAADAQANMWNQIGQSAGNIAGTLFGRFF